MSRTLPKRSTNLRHWCFVLSIAMFTVVAFVNGPAVAATIPLGNLFDDANTETLANAIASDTFQAKAEDTDLGVAKVIMGGLNADQDITGAGTTFNLTTAGGESAYWSSTMPSFYNDAFYNDNVAVAAWAGIRTTGATAPTLVKDVKVEEGMGVHANGLITFDLSEIRAAGGLAADTPFVFTAKAGQNDDQATNGSMKAVAILTDASGTVTAGYVNAQSQAVNFDSGTGVYSFDTTGMPDNVGSGVFAEFNVLISGDTKYLTLAMTGAGDGISSDHGAFSEAQLTVVPEPTTAAMTLLGLLGLIFWQGRRKQ